MAFREASTPPIAAAPLATMPNVPGEARILEADVVGNTRGQIVHRGWSLAQRCGYPRGAATCRIEVGTISVEPARVDDPQVRPKLSAHVVVWGVPDNTPPRGEVEG